MTIDEYEYQYEWQTDPHTPDQGLLVIQDRIRNQTIEVGEWCLEETTLFLTIYPTQVKATTKTLPAMSPASIGAQIKRPISTLDIQLVR